MKPLGEWGPRTTCIMCGAPLTKDRPMCLLGTMWCSGKCESDYKEGLGKYDDRDSD